MGGVGKKERKNYEGEGEVGERGESEGEGAGAEKAKFGAGLGGVEKPYEGKG